MAPGREGKRTVNRDPHAHPATLVEKLATPTGRECYAQRKRLRPMVKEVPGFRRFSARGPDEAREDLVCLARLARQASANASGNVRAPCSSAKHDRIHRASCTPLACPTRQPRCSGVSVHVFSPRSRVLSYLSTAQAPRAVACLRDDFLLTYFRYRDPGRRTINAGPFREVRRRTHPAFQDKTDRLAIFVCENKHRGIRTLFPLTRKS